MNERQVEAITKVVSTKCSCKETMVALHVIRLLNEDHEYYGTHQVMADRMGLSRGTVTRSMRLWVRQGLFRQLGHGVICLAARETWIW